MSVWHSMATCRHAPLGPHAPWGKIGSNDKWSSGALMGQAPKGRADGWAGCWAATWAGAWCWGGRLVLAMAPPTRPLLVCG